MPQFDDTQPCCPNCHATGKLALYCGGPDGPRGYWWGCRFCGNKWWYTQGQHDFFAAMLGLVPADADPTGRR